MEEEERRRARVPERDCGSRAEAPAPTEDSAVETTANQSSVSLRKPNGGSVMERTFHWERRAEAKKKRNPKKCYSSNEEKEDIKTKTNKKLRRDTTGIKGNQPMELQPNFNFKKRMKN